MWSKGGILAHPSCTTRQRVRIEFEEGFATWERALPRELFAYTLLTISQKRNVPSHGDKFYLPSRPVMKQVYI